MLWGKGRSFAARRNSQTARFCRSLGGTHVALFVLCSVFALPATAKTPGTRYCFGGWCHRVGTLAQTETLVGWRGYLIASFYDDCRRDPLNPCGLTSSGAVFRPDLPDNAASPLFPDGTVILAYNPKTGDASVLRITSAGPYSGERKLDVSRAGAERLGFKVEGTAHLVVGVLKSPTLAEATYVKRRIYPAVPGHLGKFETYDLAYAAALEKIDFDQQGATAPEANSDVIASPAGLAADGLVQEPRPAVSPSLARELTMLRLPPRPVTRAKPLIDDAAQTDDPVPAETTDAPTTHISEADALAFGLALRKFIEPANSGAQSAR